MMRRGRPVAYWWASQGNNYPTAIDQGSLWTCPRINGALPPDRALLKQIRLGDLVFHHYRSHLRAVSVVTAPWRDAVRPPGYPNRYPGRLNDGWLVTVDPLITGLEVHFERVGVLLPHGSPGPLDKNGRPHQKYLSELTNEQGRRLLDEVGLAVPESSTAVGVRVLPAPSDIAVAATRRVEQALLRSFLLDGQTEGSCGLCDQVLPAGLLVAGHIKPRAQCTDAERWAFAEVAMLVCVLGCDALFEQGYLTVDALGVISEGLSPSHPGVAAAVQSLLGRRCGAFTALRAAAFRAHREQFNQRTG